ncbi:hypothetical protein EJ06DRAFT_578967 [Trichodelitschia bisporula]|uniref:Uncharacterized protein n=1 Tax=Trichodelitschia bisporula TaxID=703511 RepID=A0A6G1I7Z1_9PEZI|nr:hypothetical protein EJ06DRAFT_578967 [Trichodelitschia bisporula]
MPDEQNHIPQPEEEEEAGLYDGPRGPLGTVLDPVGKGLQTVLSPVGAGVGVLTKPIAKGVGGITRPVIGPATGHKEEKMEVIGGNNKDSYVHGKDSLGKREQTADNPLGLDQTGKWGFRNEDEDGDQ